MAWPFTVWIDCSCDYEYFANSRNFTIKEATFTHRTILKTRFNFLSFNSYFSEHEEVMKREKEYKGIWINSNMKSHESFKDSKCQVDRAVVEVTSPDGSNKRKLGMLGVLSDAGSLYKPDAFGGEFK